jgi:type I restriction enzyme M protein
MTQSDFPAILRATRAALNLTQEQLAERLGVSFATVNRWEGGGNKPQRAAQETILALAREAGVEGAESPPPAEAAAQVTFMAWHGQPPCSRSQRRGTAGAIPGRG